MNGWKVLVWFQVATAPRDLGYTLKSRESAEREAERYACDSNGVWIVSPEGQRFKLDRTTYAWELEQS